MQNSKMLFVILFIFAYFCMIIKEKNGEAVISGLL